MSTPIYDFTTPISRAATHAEKYDARQERFGSDQVAPFWVADMDFPTPRFLVEAMEHRLSHPMFGYTTQYRELFDAISWWMKTQHQIDYARDWIRLSPSVVTSIVNGILATTHPGDTVVIPSPVYGPFFHATTQNDRVVADVPLRLTDGQYTLDFLRIEEVFRTTSPALFLLCSPHNPGGRVWTHGELTTLVALCRKWNVALFCDEIHSDIVYPPHGHTPILSIDGAPEIAISAHSVGKTFNTSGLCASWVAIPNPRLRSRFVAQARRSHTGDVNLLGKVVLETALSSSGAIYKQQLVQALHENVQATYDALSRVTTLCPMLPQATFLLWCDFRQHGPWPQVMKRLVTDANVALSGGDFFGPTGHGWFRINCAHPSCQLQTAVARIALAFSN